MSANVPTRQGICLALRAHAFDAWTKPIYRDTEGYRLVRARRRMASRRLPLLAPCPMSALGHSRPGRTGSKSGHVRYCSESENKFAALTFLNCGSLWRAIHDEKSSPQSLSFASVPSLAKPLTAPWSFSLFGSEQKDTFQRSRHFKAGQQPSAWLQSERRRYGSQGL